jgi:hypothetical protein
MERGAGRCANSLENCTDWDAADKIIGSFIRNGIVHSLYLCGDTPHDRYDSMAVLTYATDSAESRG